MGPDFLQRRTARIFAFLLVALVVAAAAPSRPSSAQTIPEIQYLDNSQGDFANGVFERTAIGPTVVSALPEDEPGVVQLAPAGALTRWDVALPGLPQAISNAGLVALGDYLFVVAGELNTGRSDKVYRAKINRVTGRPVPFDSSSGLVWKDYTIKAEDAVLVPGCQGLPVSAAARTRSGVAALETNAGGGLGFIYVIGGIVNTECENDMTTPLVQIGVVNASGDITNWIKAPYLPTPTTSGNNTTTPRGIADAMVAIARTSTNERFIYVFGGISLDPTDEFNNFDDIYKSVYYAKININTGGLINPLDGSTTQPWARAADIQFTDANSSKPGLRDGTAMAAQATKLNTSSNPPVVSTNEAIFIAGGCFQVASCSDLNPDVLKATITNPNTGAITWDSTPSTDNTPVSIAGRAGLGSTFYNGKMYLVGGSTNGTGSGSLFTVPTAFFDADLNAQKLDGTDFFVGTNDQVLPDGQSDSGRRTDVAVAVMQALPPENENNVDVHAAWVFVAGGVSDAASNPRRDSIFIGKIGGADEASGTIRTRDGWYYSSIEQVTIEGKLARVLSVRWSAEIDRSVNTQADIRVEFRKTVTADRQCEESDFTNAESDRWRPVDGDPDSNFFSKSTTTAENAFNVIELQETFPTETFEATCLQFRAYFLQNGTNTQNPSPAPSATPRLLSFSLEKVLAGAADIRLKDLDRSYTISGGALRDLTISIENLNNGKLEETLDVIEVTTPGSFFIHLCVASAPLDQPAPTLNLPQPAGGVGAPDCAVAYYEVQNHQMIRGAVLNLPMTGWRRPEAPYNAIPSLRDLFVDKGRYRVGVVIDYRRHIPESPAGELNNRGEDEQNPNGRTILIEITEDPSFELLLPAIYN